MSMYDRELKHKLQKLENIEARLDQHQRTVRLTLMGVSVLGALVLALLFHHIVQL